MWITVNLFPQPPLLLPSGFMKKVVVAGDGSYAWAHQRLTAATDECPVYKEERLILESLKWDHSMGDLNLQPGGRLIIFDHFCHGKGSILSI